MSARVLLASVTAATSLAAPRGLGSAVAARQASPCVWQVVPTPNRNPDDMDNRLTDIAVLSADDAWAIGEAQVRGEGGRGRTVILRWDGSHWRAVRHPDNDGGFTAIAASSPSDVWVANWQGFLRWDGLRWRRLKAVDPGTTSWYLIDVAALGPSDVWAVGWTVNDGVSATLTEHWDGTRWSIVPSPDPAPPSPGTKLSASLMSVAGSSSADVWAVGRWNVGCPSSYCSGGVVHTLAERWDGTSWSIVPMPDAPSAVLTDDELLAVSAPGPKDAWAVGLVSNGGFGGRSDRQLLERWDGSSWTVVPGASLGMSRLSGVVALSPNDAWSVGSTGACCPYGPLIERWDGTSWSEDQTASVSGWLSSVALGPSGEVWAVGATERRAQRTLAMRCSPA